MIAPHSITIETVSGRDSYGAPTFSDPSSVKALVRPGRVRTTNREGEQVVARGVAYVDGNVDATAAGAVVTIPAEFELPSRMPIVNATRTPNRLGDVAVTEVYF